MCGMVTSAATSGSGPKSALSFVAVASLHFSLINDCLRSQVLQSRQRTWLNVPVAPPALRGTESQPADSNGEAAPHSRNGAASPTSATGLGARFTLFWRRTDVDNHGAQRSHDPTQDLQHGLANAWRRCWTPTLLLRCTDGEGLGVLPITASMLQRGLRPAAQSILQPRCVVAQLSARIQAPGVGTSQYLQGVLRFAWLSLWLRFPHVASAAGSDSFMAAEMSRTCGSVDTGKLQPATVGVTVAAGQPIQVCLLAVSQVRLSCCACLHDISTARSNPMRRQQC